MSFFVCPKCTRNCDGDDVLCPYCGSRLAEKDRWDISRLHESPRYQVKKK
jgi:RNA polymerase subunit RPABC4/transcription elongation factor Spt4